MANDGGESLGDKGSAYAALVEQRRECRLCAELRNPSAIQNGRLDADQIGPWSRWQGNLDAQLMVVGQDWGGVRYFEDNRGLESPRNPTNEMLRELLASIGVHIGGPHDTGTPQRVFLTNAILCLKPGRLQGPVERSWFEYCGTKFLKPLIEIVRPAIVVCLGRESWTAVVGAFGHRIPRSARLRDEVESTGRLLAPGIRAVAAYHCGARVRNTHRKRAQQIADWERIGKLLTAP